MDCHGERGEGIDDVTKPLFGELSLPALAQQIERTMPEDDAKACVGADAQAVAKYIYDAFYSPKARSASSADARPDLQRLTIGQYRQSIADLVGYYRKDSSKPYTDKRGLFQRMSGRHITKKKDDKKVWVGHDEPGSEVFLSFADKPPYDDLDRTESIHTSWTGSVLADQTGEYELIVRSQNGFRAWFNEADSRVSPQVDGSVVSGSDIREMKYNIYLLAGWAYPLRVDWTVSPKEKAGSIELLWKTPGGPIQRIPARSLLPQVTPKVTAVSVPFPPDDASMGYERGTAVSAEWLEATVRGAIETASLVGDDLDELAGTKANAADRNAKIEQFCESFAARAVRRPLDAATKKRFVDDVFANAANVDSAAKRVVLLTLTSAHFLYPDAGVTQPDGYQIASRLALALWDSLPDKALTDAAGRGELSKPENVFKQAQRMLADRRAKTKLHGFFHHWLELHRAENVVKDEKVFPDFDAKVMADLRVSLELFLDKVVWSEKSDYRELLLADYLYLNERLSNLYGGDVQVGASDGFMPVNVSKEQRSGVITHPYLLTAFAYHNNTSPIHRGVFLTRNIVGRQLKPPPNANLIIDAEFDPTLTMREKVTQFTRPSACMSCHETINPLGFSLEHYDGIGRWRTKEKNKPIDSSSDFVDDHGGKIRLRGARDVAEFAVNSRPAQRAFVRQMFQHAVKQDTTAYGGAVLEDLEESFVDSGCHIRNLVARIAVVAATDGSEPPATKTASR